MPVEAATTIDQLDPANPPGTDPVSQGDDHIRLVKDTLQASFPGLKSTKVSWGWIADNGGIQGGSGDFTVAQVGTLDGQYEITFNDAAPSQFGQYIVANAQGAQDFSGQNIVSVFPVSTTVCFVAIINAATGNAADQAFCFVRNIIEVA